MGHSLSVDAQTNTSKNVLNFSVFNISALAGILLKSESVYFFSEQFFGRSE